jgi:hypothetical protein
MAEIAGRLRRKVINDSPPLSPPKGVTHISPHFKRRFNPQPLPALLKTQLCQFSASVSMQAVLYVGGQPQSQLVITKPKPK